MSGRAFRPVRDRGPWEARSRFASAGCGSWLLSLGGIQPQLTTGTQVMSDIKRQPFWKRSYTVTPGQATLVGFAIGSAVAIVAALMPPRDFSWSSLLILLFSITPFTGIFGYIAWLTGDAVREERLRRITSFVAFPAMLVLLAAFPGFWWRMGRSLGSPMVVMFMGFVCAMAMFAVGAGLGLVHLVGHLAGSFQRSAKPGTTRQTDGVWDRELDAGWSRIPPSMESGGKPPP